MRFFPLAAVAAVAAGVSLLGASLGGMSRVDEELARTARPAPTVRFDQVLYRSGDAARSHGARRHHRSHPEL